MCKVRHPMALPEHLRNRVDEYSGAYSVTIDRTYVVGAMMISENRLLFLIRDDHDDPLFVPAACFDVTSQDIPDGWQFALTTGARIPDSSWLDYPVPALWGYPEFVHDAQHINELGELEPHALAIFDRYVRKVPG